MDRPIKKKKPDTPDWVINSLKGLLLLLLAWNIYQHFPKNSKPSFKTAPYYDDNPKIEKIKYNELLSTTHPKIENYLLHWAKQEIPFMDPELMMDDASSAIQLTYRELKLLLKDSFSLQYKNHPLHIQKITTIFLNNENEPIFCENESGFGKCFQSGLLAYKNDFELWLAIETLEEKAFFSKIKISESNSFQLIKTEASLTFWKNIINKHKYKSVDNLNVVKPVFRHNDYLFQWGAWERYARGPRGGRPVKLSIEQFKNWAKHQPKLFKENEFIPFNVYIKLWNGKRERNNCWLRRSTLNESAIVTNDCFKKLAEKAKPGDIFSLFIYIKNDFLSQLSHETLQSFPSFVFNSQRVQMYIPVELSEEIPEPRHTPLKLTTSEYSFQLNTIPGQKASIKMDKYAPENSALLTHYETSQSAEIIHIPNFKTIRRVLTEADVYLDESEIGHTYTLTEKVYVTNTFPEFYDFPIFPPLIKSGGLSTVLDKTTYRLKDYQHKKPSFELYLGEEKAKILQFRLTIVPKKGKATRYITNKMNRYDIRKRLNRLQPETSLYFDDILFERANGEQMVFPLATAIHLK